MMEDHLFDFDFIETYRPLGLAIGEGEHDAWFSIRHPELFEAPLKLCRSSRTSSFGGRRLSGRARRCSATGATKSGKENSQPNVSGTAAGEGSADLGKAPSHGATTASSIFSPAGAGGKTKRTEGWGSVGAAPPREPAVAAPLTGSEAAVLSPGPRSTEENDPVIAKDPMRSRLRDYRMQKGKSGPSRPTPPSAAAAKRGPRPAGKAPAGGIFKPTATSSARQLPSTTTTTPRPVVARPAASVPPPSSKSKAPPVSRPSPSVARLQPAGTAVGSHGKSSTISKNSSTHNSSTNNKRTPLASEDEDMNRLVAQHNKRFKAQHTYQPSLSFKSTRKWELKTGKEYRSLSMADREQANAEIVAMEQEEKKPGGGEGEGSSKATTGGRA